MNWKTTRTEFTEILPQLFASYPFILLMVFYLFVLRARLHLGYWPTPYHPDPKDLDFALHHSIIWVGILAVPMFIVTAVVLIIAGRVMGVNRRIWPNLTLLAFSHLILFAVARQDPWHLLEWFMD